jgi:hemolysin activation/secretion protein
VRSKELLGGREYVRGYESYRFRGNDLLMFSTELRRTVYKKTDRRGVDVFGFADSGQVWGDARSSALAADQAFSSSNWRSGVEAAFNTDTHLRSPQDLKWAGVMRASGSIHPSPRGF